MSTPSILIIDDDDTILSVVEKTLEQNGFSVAVASSGKEGLSIAKTFVPSGIILDKKMPEMTGEQVLVQLKSTEETKAIPVMMLTSKNDIDDVSNCLEIGACDYIVKPFDHDNLIVRVRNMLRK